MPANIEIKAHATDFDAQSAIAEEIADGPVIDLNQTDTFFNVPLGRLKLREFGDGSGELIQYQRPDQSGPRTSSYVISRTSEPATLKAALTAALGVRSVVRKHRQVWLTGKTRLHFDQVEELGEFIELEVVLGAEDSEEEGRRIVRELMQLLGIAQADLIACAYVDLIERRLGSTDRVRQTH